jgi:RNA polymerase sigma-70 factor, ECF subfamily
MSAVARQKSQPDVPDDVLVRRAAGGDEAAFSQLFLRHSRYVAGIVHRLLGSDADLDDVVQLSFLEALRSIEHIEDAGTFRGWLYRITVRQVNRRLKKRWRLGRLRAALELVTFGRVESKPVPELIDLERVLALTAPEDRVAWTLHYVQGESLSETAVLCECSLATVKRRIARAEKLVARRFE